MEFKIAHSFSSINEEDIQTFEKTYNLSLPLEYKTFLLQHNGGQPEWNKIKMYDAKHDASLGTILKFFLPLYKEAEDNLETTYAKYAKGKVIPSKFLPIAIAPRKNLLCLSLRKKDYGAVYYFEIDDFDKENLKEETRTLAATSFPKFLDALALEYDTIPNPVELVPLPSHPTKEEREKKDVTIGKIQWWDVEEVTEEEIHKVEEELGISFPGDYKEYVKKCNGGFPNRDEFYFDDGFYSVSLRNLISLHHDMLATYEDVKSYIPEKVIPFMETRSGDFLCFDFRESLTSPPIVYMNHEEEGDESLSALCDTFTDLVTGLEFEKD
ncbi:SMI1/KNR4 family protein [Priestia endophytica]|uniref:Knr4/Smi1-like domain-containing protein n=1 Tax=Priestia endophytica TaxID=135735 RepID=A0AAX1QEP5_9BACI|nr:SMI1/KNR4 family protein [Priestia endophytica]RAS82275.1 hypothetical protein A3864_01845 [Priestia endophytica]RAS84360.1 hypothetical protein A3863_24475 [Priestia endophytica]